MTHDRFINGQSADQLGTPHINRYAYVGNNPVNEADPSGLAATGALFSMSYGDGREMAGSSKSYGNWQQENIDIQKW